MVKGARCIARRADRIKSLESNSSAKSSGCKGRETLWEAIKEKEGQA